MTRDASLNASRFWDVYRHHSSLHELRRGNHNPLEQRHSHSLSSLVISHQSLYRNACSTFSPYDNDFFFISTKCTRHDTSMNLSTLLHLNKMHNGSVLTIIYINYSLTLVCIICIMYAIHLL